VLSLYVQSPMCSAGEHDTSKRLQCTCKQRNICINLSLLPWTGNSNAISDGMIDAMKDEIEYMGDVMDTGLSSWSYSMWFNTNNDVASQVLFSKALAASSNGRIWSEFYNNRVVFGFQAEVTNVLVTEMNTSTLSANTWYHLVVVLDRSDKLKIYLNGTLQGLTVTSGTNDLTPYTTNYNNTHPFRIGAYTASDNTTPIAFFNGKIDEFGAWSRVLTSTEITELYNSGTGKFYPY